MKKPLLASFAFAVIAITPAAAQVKVARLLPQGGGIAGAGPKAVHVPHPETQMPTMPGSTPCYCLAFQYRHFEA